MALRDEKIVGSTERAWYNRAPVICSMVLVSGRVNGRVVSAGSVSWIFFPYWECYIDVVRAMVWWASDAGTC